MNLLRNRSFPKLTRTLVLVLGVGSALALANPPPACSHEPSQIAVSYRDLNLSQPADVRALYQRLQRASSSVCGEVPRRELSRHLAWQRCYDAALEDAVVQINAPQLLALHRSELGARHG